MMPPDPDLKAHLANRRSLAEARATYLACAGTRTSQGTADDIPSQEKICLKETEHLLTEAAISRE
jgi:hypothetical protein